MAASAQEQDKAKLSKEEAKQLKYDRFDGYFKGVLVEQILDHARGYKLPQDYIEYFKKSLLVNTTGGKCNRGMSVPDSVAVILNKGELSEDEYNKTATLGWMIELMQAFFLVSDDIMDSSTVRRGEPCWYLREGIGMVAINDAFLLESSLYLLLKQHFRTHKSYVDMMELFHEVVFQTELGQLCDLLTAPEDHVDLTRFNLDKYSFIVIYKTAYYSFYLPVALALHYLNIATPKNLATARAILVPMGEYFQIQDDYLDNFGDQAQKRGTDIMDNKCSWLVNTALQRATPPQRALLDKYYGRKNEEDEKHVKALYDEMKLADVYREYEEGRVGELKRMIADVDESDGLKKDVFTVFLDKIYKRTV